MECSFEQHPGIPESFFGHHHVTVEQCYGTAEGMAEAARYVKESQGAACYMLPFCHTIEAESLGAIVKTPEGLAGPRIATAAFENIGQIIPQFPIKFDDGRIKEAIDACKILKEYGQPVIYEVSGPVTILSGLLDMTTLFRGFMKETQESRRLLELLKNELISFVEKLCDAAVDDISFGDPAGALDIVGPKISRRMAEIFLIPFINEVLPVMEGKAVLSLCPKTTMLLLTHHLAKIETLELERPMSYQEAIIQYKHQLRMTGTVCMKNIRQKATTIDMIKMENECDGKATIISNIKE